MTKKNHINECERKNNTENPIKWLTPSLERHGTKKKKEEEEKNLNLQSSSMVNVHWCKYFGHVQRFRSYSFGHLE